MQRALSIDLLILIELVVTMLFYQTKATRTSTPGLLQIGGLVAISISWVFNNVIFLVNFCRNG